MRDKIKIILYGLGSIGTEVARCALGKEELEVVGAIDLAEEKVGKDLGQLLDLDRKVGLRVSQDPHEVFSQTPAQIVLHTTLSSVKAIYPQIAQAIKAGVNVISTCEELSYPWLQNPDIAAELDNLAKEYGVTVLGTGVNPGFVLDTLILALSGLNKEVKNIKARRVVDVAKRRYPLQKKVGAGLWPEEFRSRVEEKRLGHVGLIESVALLAYGLGWPLADIQETINPVIAPEPIETEFFKIEKGQVTGIDQVARGLIKGAGERIRLDLQMYLDAPDPQDFILIEGTPQINLKIEGGVEGDAATVGMVINSISRVLKAQPGLLTSLDLPQACYL